MWRSVLQRKRGSPVNESGNIDGERESNELRTDPMSLRCLLLGQHSSFPLQAPPNTSQYFPPRAQRRIPFMRRTQLTLPIHPIRPPIRTTRPCLPPMPPLATLHRFSTPFHQPPLSAPAHVPPILPRASPDPCPYLPLGPASQTDLSIPRLLFTPFLQIHPWLWKILIANRRL